jgi:PiT family inorganic phosphate transporter
MLLALLVATFVVALAFDFTNGFHDTANAIATSVSTRAMTSRQAVALSAVLNLVGALVTVTVFGGAVSNTIASLLPHPGLVIIMSGLLGAIAWNLLTWYRGLPSSSTHAFVGGLIGAGVAAAGGPGGVHWHALIEVVIGLVISPPIGFVLAFALMTLLYLVLRRVRPARINVNSRRLQILSSAAVSYGHGSNDAQKSMAAMALALVAAGRMAHFHVPIWVVGLSAASICLGTYAGGWRIIRTLGWRIYKLDPATGVAAQVTSAVTILVGTAFGFPVSTTHVVTGAVMGAGAPRRLSPSSWGVGANILAAWLLTIPAAGAFGWVCYAVLHTAHL